MPPLSPTISKINLILWSRCGLLPWTLSFILLVKYAYNALMICLSFLFFSGSQWNNVEFFIVPLKNHCCLLTAAIRCVWWEMGTNNLTMNNERNMKNQSTKQIKSQHHISYRIRIYKKFQTRQKFLTDIQR